MKRNPGHNRRSIRLRGYDYTSEGAYFITICTKDRQLLFGDVIEGETQRTRAGRIVADTWDALPEHYPQIELDAFVIMPNHIHAIVVLVGAGFKPAPPSKTASLSEIIRGFETFSARRINEMRGTPSVSIWQRGFHDHIIRSADSLNRIRRYIAANARRWMFDRENPNADRFGSAEPWEVPS